VVYKTLKTTNISFTFERKHSAESKFYETKFVFEIAIFSWL